MKLKNAYIFILACTVLACDYAIAGYPTPSLFLSCTAAFLSLGVLNPSRKIMGKFIIHNSCIAIIEIIILLFIGHASTWSYTFLAISIVISCGCWKVVYLRSKKVIKNFILNSIQVMCALLILAMFMILLLPLLSTNMRLEILQFLILMFSPLLITISFTYLQNSLKYNINLESKKVRLQ